MDLLKNGGLVRLTIRGSRCGKDLIVFGYLNQVHAHNYYPEFVWDDTQKKELKT